MQALKRILLAQAGLLSVMVVTGLFAAEDAPAPQTAAPTNTATTLKTKRPISSYLVFDEETKFYDAKLTDTNHYFQFSLTNTWTNEITIDRIETSCGCTLGTLPSNPWHIAPGEHGVVGATVNLEGKPAGLMTKMLTNFISAKGKFAGAKILTVKINVPKRPGLEMLSEADRKAAMVAAKADSRKIFTDPKCAKCHVEPGKKETYGPRLYAADCGICHDSPIRDSAVPDLRALKAPLKDIEYWTAIITFGKTNTMMPAFAESKGGPLNDKQVHELAQYLTSNEFLHPIKAKAH